MKIVCHPPEKDELRAYVPYDECREKFSHFKRNRNIVDSVNLLLWFRGKVNGLATAAHGILMTMLENTQLKL